jgi:putative transposase
MPWKTVFAMQERMKFITAVDEQDASFAELCRGFGISRKTGYKWLERYEEEGPRGLEVRGSAARANAKALSEEQVDAIVELRREHPTWGPKKLRARLESLGTCRPLPATSTVGTVLKRYGLVRPRRHRSRGPRELTGLTVGERPNDVWCVDFKGDFKLGDRTRCYPLTMTDFESRYLLTCTALSSTKEESARDVFERVFREFGLPEYIRSDNGVPFSSVAIGGVTKLCIWWIKLGIIPERIEPAHPEQNGRHERMHRTLKAEATRPARYDLIGQQRAFDLFRHEYNDLRPHEGIGLRTPASRYALSRRTMPNELQTPTYPETMTTRRIDDAGRLQFRGHHVMLTRALARECVGLEDLDNGLSDIYFGPLRLGAVCIQGKELVLNQGATRRIRAAVTL